MFLIYLYIFCTILAHPFAKHYIERRVESKKESESRYRERFAEPSRDRPEGILIWFNAVSIGELNVILPVIRHFQKEYPQKVHFLITTTTVSSSTVLDNAALPDVIHQYFPLDTPHFTKKFIEYWKPDLVVFTESEIWPNMVLNIRDYNCPLILINARLSDRSFKKWKWIKGSMHMLLKQFQTIFPGSIIDKERFEYFMSDNVGEVMSLKNAAPPISANAEMLAAFKKQVKGRKVVVYASTHRGEEDEIIHAHVELRLKYPELLTIIVPRHVNRAEEIRGIARKHNIQSAIHSENKEQSLERAEIYIVDTVGELGTFYRLGGIAFVGGSMIERGGHNILEPAKLGCAVLSGPHTFNFTEITQSFIEANALTIVKDHKDLVQNIHKMFDSPKLLKELQYRSLQISQKQDGIIQHTVSYLSALIPTLSANEIFN